MPMVLYQYPGSAPCRAVTMVAEKLGIELEQRYVDLFAGEQLKPEFLKINPQHCVPTLDDNGFCLWESRAILTYLVNTYAPECPLYPKDLEVRAAVDRMLYFDLGTIFKTQLDYLMNPQHCVPTIDDNGFYLWESRVILTYLVSKFAPESCLYPKDPKQRAAVDRMLYFDLGTIYKTQSDYLRPVMFEGRPVDPEKKEAFKKALGVFEQLLEKTSYAAANHLTLADYSLFATLSYTYLVGGFDLTTFPKVWAWFEKLKKEIPHYKEINETPLKEFKAFLVSRRKAAS